MTKEGFREEVMSKLKPVKEEQGAHTVRGGLRELWGENTACPEARREDRGKWAFSGCWEGGLIWSDHRMQGKSTKLMGLDRQAGVKSRQEDLGRDLTRR